MSTTALRINLIPEAETGMNLLGQHVGLGELRSVAVAIFVAILAVIPGFVTMALFTAKATGDIATITDQISQQDQKRQDLLAIADEVARFQSIDHAAGVLAVSGRMRALRLAQLGNALPQNVWYDRLDQDTGGWHISGRSRGIDDIASAITQIGSTTPGVPAALENIKQGESALQFAAYIGAAKGTVLQSTIPAQTGPAANGRFTPGQRFVMPPQRPGP